MTRAGNRQRVRHGERVMSASSSNGVDAYGNSVTCGGGQTGRVGGGGKGTRGKGQGARDKGQGLEPGAWSRERSVSVAFDKRVVAASVCAAGLLVLAVWGLSSSSGPVRVSLLEPPGRDAVPAITGDRAVLISGRHVTPAGRVIRTQSFGWGTA